MKLWQWVHACRLWWYLANCAAQVQWHCCLCEGGTGVEGESISTLYDLQAVSLILTCSSWCPVGSAGPGEPLSLSLCATISFVMNTLWLLPLSQYLEAFVSYVLFIYLCVHWLYNHSQVPIIMSPVSTLIIFSSILIIQVHWKFIAQSLTCPVHELANLIQMQWTT